MKKIRKQKPASEKGQTTLSDTKSAFSCNEFEMDFLLEYPTDRIFRAFKNRTEADQHEDSNFRNNVSPKS